MARTKPASESDAELEARERQDLEDMYREESRRLEESYNGPPPSQGQHGVSRGPVHEVVDTFLPEESDDSEAEAAAIGLRRTAEGYVPAEQAPSRPFRMPNGPVNPPHKLTEAVQALPDARERDVALHPHAYGSSPPTQTA